METLLRQMRGNLSLKKWKHCIEIWRHFVLSDGCTFISLKAAPTSDAEISRFEY